ncbi:MAG: 3-phosphoglycerate dehydrogenase [Acholeplasmatales bacterium]|nr:3-phosphoglycerate dehydrogenase [Acholeplasmatales bacterium]
MKAYCLNNISKVALDGLKKPDTVVADIKDCDSILVRSANMLEMDLDKNVLAVARAGAGVNNIPLQKYADNGVVVFNTPGANANAVKELVLCALLLASRDIIGGNKWVCENASDENIAKTAEKAKSKFAGCEIKGKTLAVVGLGVIGVKVANACVALGMKVVGYDPYLSINNAMQLDKNVKYYEKLADVVKDADYITIHVPALDSTKKMINKEVFDSLTKNAILVNFSRDTLVNEADLKAALEAGKITKYVTDFANANVVTLPNTIILPHLGASTEEAEDNCAVMAINELKDFIENGNITHSVNYPDLNGGVKPTESRVAICHKNISGIISKFTNVITTDGANIENFISKSKGDYAYSLIDVNGKFDIKDIEKMDGVLRVRVL